MDPNTNTQGNLGQQSQQHTHGTAGSTYADKTDPKEILSALPPNQLKAVRSVIEDAYNTGVGNPGAHGTAQRFIADKYPFLNTSTP